MERVVKVGASYHVNSKWSLEDCTILDYGSQCSQIMSYFVNFSYHEPTQNSSLRGRGTKQIKNGVRNYVWVTLERFKWKTMWFSDKARGRVNEKTLASLPSTFKRGWQTIWQNDKLDKRPSTTFKISFPKIF